MSASSSSFQTQTRKTILIKIVAIPVIIIMTLLSSWQGLPILGYTRNSNISDSCSPEVVNVKSSNHSNHSIHNEGMVVMNTITTPSSENNTDVEKNKCSFLQPYETNPVPLILIAMGRTGSSVTWDTISTLLGSTTKAYEITGGNATKSRNFFDSIDLNLGSDWAIERLCKVQNYNVKNFEDPVISGFQWKPYDYTFIHPYGKGALEKIAAFNNPPIRVLYLSRNPLDKIISNMRHKGYQHSKEVPAHCDIDDKECIKRHEAHSQGIAFANPQMLVHDIKGSLRLDQKILDFLSSNGVKHISVSYEKLYDSGDDVKEWVRIFDFLGRSPKHVQNYATDLTRQHIQDAFAFAPTSTQHHNEMITNYWEVKKVLEDAGLDYLLH